MDGEADYVLALKGNQETLHRAVADYITDHLEDDFARVRVSRFEEKEKGHGRQEHRLYYQLNAPADLAGRDKMARIEDDWHRHSDLHDGWRGTLRRTPLHQ